MTEKTQNELLDWVKSFAFRLTDDWFDRHGGAISIRCHDAEAKALRELVQRAEEENALN